MIWLSDRLGAEIGGAEKQEWPAAAREIYLAA